MGQTPGRQGRAKAGIGFEALDNGFAAVDDVPSTAEVVRGPERVVAGQSGRRMIIGGCEYNEDQDVGRGSQRRS